MFSVKQLLAGASTVVCLVSTLSAQVDEVAKQALLDSAEAIQELDSVTYEAKKYGTGPLAGLIDVSGEVRISRPAKVGGGQLTYVDGRIVLRGQPDKLFRMSSNGKNVTFVDFDEQAVMERPISDRRGAKQAYDLGKQLVINEFADLNPFVKTIDNSEMITMKGVEELNGVVCNVVEAGAAGGARKTVWHIGVGDKLPRKMAMVTGQGENAVSLVLELVELASNDAMKVTDFEVQVPAGFRVQKMEAAKPPVPVAPVKVDMGIARGKNIPDFKLRTADGNRVGPADFIGQTVVMAFCGSKFTKSVECLGMLEEQREFFQDEAITFLAVTCREDSDDAARAMLKDSGANLTLLLDGETVMSRLQVTGSPSVYVIGPDGRVQDFFVGCPTEAELLASITAAAE